MATGFPRARRLGEDGPRELDDRPLLIQEDVAIDCLHVLCDGILPDRVHDDVGGRCHR